MVISTLKLSYFELETSTNMSPFFRQACSCLTVYSSGGKMRIFKFESYRNAGYYDNNRSAFTGLF